MSQTQQTNFNPVVDVPVTENLNQTQHFGGTPTDFEETTYQVPPTGSYEVPPFQETNQNSNQTIDIEEEKSPEQAADIAIGAYEYLMQFPVKLVLFNEKKLEELHRKGEIDLKIPVPFDANGNLISVEEYVKIFNKEAEKAGIVDSEFKSKVHPLLVKIFKKKGLGLTDEQTLMILIGQDVIQRGIALFSLKAQNNQIIEHLKSLKAESKQQNSAPNQQYQNTTQQKPQEPEENTASQTQNSTNSQSAANPNVTVVPDAHQKGKRGRKAGTKNKPKPTNIEDAVVISETK